MSDRISGKIVRILSRFSICASGLAIAFGIMVLTGWIFHIQRLKGLILGQATVKPNTAICFILLGAALGLAKSGLRRRPARPLSILLALLASFVGLLSLLEGWKGWDFRIDQLLFHAGPDDLPGSLRPALMSSLAAADFFLLGITTALLGMKRRWSSTIQSLLPSIAAGLAMFGVLDFVLCPQDTHAHIAPLTAMILLFCSFAVLWARTDERPAALLASATSGGVLCRRLLPAAILVPMGIAWLRWEGQQLRLFSDWTGLAIMTVTAAGLLTGLILWTAVALDRSEATRRRAEEETVKEREKFNSILDVLTPYVVLLTPDYRVAFANREFRRRFGDSHGKRCIEFLFGRTEACENCETYKVLDTRQPQHWDWTGPDGKSYEVHDFPFTDTDGSMLILEMGIDVTERKQAELAREESKARFRVLADFVPQLVWMCHPDGLNFYFNQRWVDYTGMSLDDCYGRNWSKPFHPDDRQAAWNAWNHATETGDPYLVESRLRAADGSYRWFLMRGVPQRDATGRIVKWFGTCTDIDDMKRAEQEIRKLNGELEARVEQRTLELRESEQRVRHKLDCILSPEGDLGNLELPDVLDIPAAQSWLEDFHAIVHVTTALIDLQGNILASVGWQDICRQFHRVNPNSCQNCLESDRELSVGIPAGQFTIYKCKNHMWDAATPIFVGGRQVGNLFCGQFFFEDEPIDREAYRRQARQYGFDEKEYMAALDAVPRLSRQAVNASMGFLAKLAGMISQLSYSSIKLAQSSEKMRRVNSELTTSIHDLEAFTYSVSHDLRAPLRHISGFSKILSEEYAAALPSEARHHLQRICAGTQRMGQLVDDLLNLGRVGRKDLLLQVAGLRPIVDDVIAGLKSDVGDRRVTWKIEDLPFVECDPALMEQVFQNLLSNALKFTRPRSRAVIEVGQMQLDGAAVVYVKDNGVGFSMKYADKLFGVFQRLHRAEDFDGTGVGLATVQRIIQKHGGRIWAHADLDKGASFYFTLGNRQSAEDHSKALVLGGVHDGTTD